MESISSTTNKIVKGEKEQSMFTWLLDLLFLYLDFNVS